MAHVDRTLPAFLLPNRWRLFDPRPPDLKHATEDAQNRVPRAVSKMIWTSRDVMLSSYGEEHEKYFRCQAEHHRIRPLLRRFTCAAGWPGPPAAGPNDDPHPSILRISCRSQRRTLTPSKEKRSSDPISICIYLRRHLSVRPLVPFL